MSFFLLLKEHLRYLLRSKIVHLVLVFSFFIHFFGLRIIRYVGISVQGVMTTIGPREGLFVVLLLQIFLGVFLAAIYGIWMVPYQHQGPRSALTFVLPVNKWFYPAVYAVSFGLLLLLQFLMLGVGYELVFGWQKAAIREGVIFGFCIGLLVEFLACEFAWVFFSVLAMSLGQVATFFTGMFLFFVLQVLGIAFRFGLDHFAEVFGGKAMGLYHVYQWLPPAGEIVFVIRKTFRDGLWPSDQVFLWVGWTLIFVLLFRWKLRYPVTAKLTEG